MSACDIGVIGLGVMGQNLALNIASRGYSVIGYDLDAGKVAAFVDRGIGGQILHAADTLECISEHLSRPRKVLIMVPAGKPVDAVIRSLLPHLEEGDILIDGGNSHFEETTRRLRELDVVGIRYIGAGVSGGEEGALRGPSIMPGGSEEAWPHVKEFLQSISAKVDDGTACCDWIGPEGAGHFVKMVHNGIEYADMQLICEAYWIMHQALGMNADQMRCVFEEWNRGELDSYLIEITSKILGTLDSQTGAPMIDVILDTAGQKGTGKWTSVVALDHGVPAPTIGEAVFSRFLSSIKEERVHASVQLPGPGTSENALDLSFVDKIRDALYASKICAYAQGFALLKSASEEFGWGLDLGGISLLWREGCIIRARFLTHIKAAFDKDPQLSNLLLNDHFKSSIAAAQSGWRDVVKESVAKGIPVPAFSSAISYYDAYRSDRLPANLLQAQRDFFGAHTYERVDQPRGDFFHTDWDEKA